MPDHLSRCLRSARAASGAYGINPAAEACATRTRAQPDPASLETNPSNIRVGGKQYTKVAGLTWVESGDPQSRIHLPMFRWGRPSFRAKISPPPCRRRQLRKRQRAVCTKALCAHPEPLQAFIDMVIALHF